MQNSFQDIDPYVQYKETIQEILYRVLTKADFPLEPRLFSILYFSNTIGSFFYPGTHQFSEEKLAKEVDKIADNAFEALWLKEFQNQKVNLTLPMSMIASMLIANLPAMTSELQILTKKAFSYYVSNLAESDDFPFIRLNEEMTDKFREMANTYRTSRERVKRLLHNEINHFIESYCTHFLFVHDYLNEAHLFDYVQYLLLHVAMLKFCMYGHPEIIEFTESFETSDRSGYGQKNLKDSHSISKTLQNIMQTFSNGIIENETPLLKLRQEIQKQQLNSLNHSVLFIYF